jgi:hypothetical protein
MSRPVTTLVVFFIAFNLFAGMLISTGVAGAIGLDANVGGDDAVDESVNKADKVSTGTGLGSTLFGMYNLLASGASDVFNAIFPGLNMLHRAGVPSWITGGLLGPLFSIVIFVDIVSFLRGWGL